MTASPVIPVAAQQDFASHSAEEERGAERKKNDQPLRVAILRDDKLSGFERKTLILAKWGFIVASLSVLAACFAGYSVYQQFDQMKAQTKILSDSFEKQKADSAAAAVSTKGQLTLMQGQLDQAQDAFRTDERAWVGIRDIETARPTPLDEGLIFFRMHLRNAGKTVASYVRVHIEQVGSGPSYREDWAAIRRGQDQAWRDSRNGERIVTPDIPFPREISPGDTVPVPFGVGGAEPKFFTNGVVYSYLVGRIDYLDTFGIPHWLRFCYVIENGNGELRHCRYGNDGDTNPEIPKPHPNPK